MAKFDFEGSPNAEEPGNPLHRFVGASLRATEILSPDDETFQVTDTSSKPTRIVGRDKRGRVIEETVTVCNPMAWMHPCGAINNVPMACGPAAWNSPGNRAYKMKETVRMLQAGWIPRGACPYTREFAHVTNTPRLVDDPNAVDGSVDGCDGGDIKTGCDHFRALVVERTRLAREQHDEDQRMFSNMSPQAAATLARQIGQALGIVNEIAGVTPSADVALAPAKPKLPQYGEG